MFINEKNRNDLQRNIQFTTDLGNKICDMKHMNFETLLLLELIIMAVVLLILIKIN